MINKINNIQELNAERLRLQYKRYELEADIKNDIHLIKESLKPMNILKSQVRDFKWGQPDFANSVVNNTLGFGLNFLVTKVLFRRASFIKKIIASFLIKKYGVDLINKNTGAIYSGVKQIIDKVKSLKKKKTNYPPSPHDDNIYDSTTVADRY